MNGASQGGREVEVVEVRSLLDGVGQLYAAADAGRGQPMLVVSAVDPTSDDLGLSDAMVGALAAAIGVEAPDTLGTSRWRGGPVLGVGVNTDAVGLIANDPRVSLLIVVSAASRPEPEATSG